MTTNLVTQWLEQLLPLVKETSLSVPAELPDSLALLSADTDRTQQYVFQSARLPEIRGASMRLDDLNQKGLPAVLIKFGLPTGYLEDDPPGCLIYNGGGSLLALVPATLADDIANGIEALYPREAGAATITAVWREISVAEARGVAAEAKPPTGLTPAQLARWQQGGVLTPIQRLMRRQELTLRQRKQAKTDVPHFETSPYARLCNSCGRRPVSEKLDGLQGEPPRYLCQICHTNDRDGRNLKSSWNRAFEAWCRTHKQQEVEAPQASDLTEIGRVANRYIGFIYADGNAIGRHLQATASLAAYGRLSQHLITAIQTAVFEALYTHLYRDRQMLPFEIITIGGDDVLLIVPAHTALPVARHICATFGDQMRHYLPQETQASPAAPISMSAGVVIAQENNPIYFINDLAKQLLASAKKRRGEACLDYMVLKSQSTLATNLQDVRRSDYLRVQHKQNNERCLLTGRPYTLAEVDKLLAGTRRLKQIQLSPGQLHEMRRQFRQGRWPGFFYYGYQRARLGRMSHQYGKALAAIEAEWGLTEPEGAPPWRPLPEVAADGFTEFDTPLLDMLTLRDFIGND